MYHTQFLPLFLSLLTLVHVCVKMFVLDLLYSMLLVIEHFLWLQRIAFVSEPLLFQNGFASCFEGGWEGRGTGAPAGFPRPECPHNTHLHESK